MNLYRVGCDWSNQRIALAGGCVYELTDEEAAQYRADCSDLTQLTEPEAEKLLGPLRAAGVANPSFRPPRPGADWGRGAQEAMSTGNMPGLTRG